uniref:Solute carrier family 19 member 3 n=1 Tax=Paramormyrops kingsleyae TaxID=1676925 RepID=A0A3B3T4B9_9TELE
MEFTAKGWMDISRCGYGFFSVVRPGVPFLTPFLTGPYENVTITQVSRQIYPVWTYSNIILPVPTFLLTDFLRYKPVVILCCNVHLQHWNSMDVGYYSYICSVVHAEGSIFLGFAVGSLTAQFLASFGNVSLYWLNVITLICLSIALLSSCLLPIPRRSLLLNELHPSALKIDFSSDPGKSSRFTFRSVKKANWRNVVGNFVKLMKDFKECYSSVTVLFLSLWWSVGKCGFYQVSNYVQILWFSKEPPDNFTAYNGAVDAVATISGKHVLISSKYTLVLGIFSPLSAGAVYLTDIGSSIWVCYVCFVVLKTSYMMLITKNMHVREYIYCYALIFGVNSFLATVLQTILTAIVINTESVIATYSRTQVGSHFGMIANINSEIENRDQLFTYKITTLALFAVPLILVLFCIYAFYNTQYYNCYTYK